MTDPAAVDLHTHSVFSDGTLTPQALAHRAAARGVRLWALTDHDDTAGCAEAAQAAHGAGIDFLAGVEISVTFAGETVHIVGLGVDPDHPPLAEGLRAIRALRATRAQAMGDELARLGWRDAYAGALALAGSAHRITRTHFARHLVASGRFPAMRDVFKRVLGDGKPGHVAQAWAPLSDALGWIHGAGGQAVVVHPARYRLSPNAEWALFHDFAGHGGNAVEVASASHWPEEVARYAEIAEEFGLTASRGSDFHDPLESRVDLGGGPALPAGCAPVWPALAERVQRA